ncbi:glycosyltransferase [Geminicoccus harenae]|uniref:glycosyltransferase n=2 Tax=Geminicoccus harenae TaxID=2498453 RepID=UPI001C94C9D6|nr:glycosyltransferase [Geminicoccus harenae]
MTDLELLLLLDPRLPDAEARALVRLVDRLAARGWRIGLLGIRSGLFLPGRPIAPPLAASLAARQLVLVDADRPVSSRILLAWHLAPLLARIDRPPRIRADHAILRFDQLPWRDGRPDRELLAALRHRFAALAEHAALHEVAVDRSIAAALGLDSEPWLPPAPPVGTTPHPAWTRRPTVIGRHGGQGNAAWPMDEDGFARAYPARAPWSVELLAPPLALLRRRIDRPLPELRLIPAEAEPVDAFLARLDVWHLAGWPGQPQPVTAELVEAAAAGVPLSLPAELAGWPEDGASFHTGTFREPGADRQARAERARAFVRESADPAILAARLLTLAPDLARPRRIDPARIRSPRRVLMLSPNGIGMGHLTRLLAVARRLPPAIEPVFLTMSQAVGVVGQYGFHGEYLPYHSYYGGDADYWNRGLLARLQAMIGFYDPRVLLFDGNMPYAALTELRRHCPERRFVWLRRGLWRPDAGKAAIERAVSFDLVIEPGEFATEADRGLTRTRGGQVVRVPPVTLLDDDEILDRAEARAELGIAPDALAVLVLLGSQNNFDYRRVRQTLAASLGEQAGVVLVEAEWLISENQPTERLPGASTLSGFPMARLFRAFDLAVSAAGYNSFHELISIGIPTIFVPNENPSMDEQEARAAWAERAGLGVAVRVHQQDRLRWALHALQAPEVAARMRERVRHLPPTDGGAAIARLVEEQAALRDAETGPPHLPHLAPHSAPLVG